MAGRLPQLLIKQSCVLAHYWTESRDEPKKKKRLAYRSHWLFNQRSSLGRFTHKQLNEELHCSLMRLHKSNKQQIFPVWTVSRRSKPQQLGVNAAVRWAHFSSTSRTFAKVFPQTTRVKWKARGTVCSAATFSFKNDKRCILVVLKRAKIRLWALKPYN